MNWFGEPGRLDESRSVGAIPSQTGTQPKNPKPDWARPDHKRLDFKRQLFNAEYCCEIQPTAYCIHLQYVVLNSRLTLNLCHFVLFPRLFGFRHFVFNLLLDPDLDLTLVPVNREPFESAASAIQVCILDPTLPSIAGTNKFLRKYKNIWVRTIYFTTKISPQPWMIKTSAGILYFRLLISL